MRSCGAILLVLGLAGAAGAGEILFANGSRLEGELASEVLMVSTGSGLLEVAPEQIALLTRGEILLKDGRMIRGTLVGGHVKARTALGEITIKADELQAFRAAGVVAPAARVASTPAPTSAPATAPPPPVPQAGAGATAADAPPAPRATMAVDKPLPPVTPSQVSIPPHAPAGTPVTSADAPAVGATLAAVGPGVTVPPPAVEGRRLEVVVGETALYRDAYATASRVGRVVRGQLVTYLDFIDRRLQILNTLLFDGGHWVKVRAGDGTEGWLPADLVREVR